MKKSFLLGTLTCIAIGAIAQTANPKIESLKKLLHGQVMQHIAAQQPAASKTTGTSYRLQTVAINAGGTTPITDSAFLKYSGSRTSKYNYLFMGYNLNNWTPVNSGNMVFPYYVAPDHEVDFDSLTALTYNTSTLVFDATDGTYRKFNAATGLLEDELSVTLPSTVNSQSISVYNAAGKSIRAYEINNPLTTKDTSMVRFSTYNALNQALVDSMHYGPLATAINQDVFHYFYNSANQLTSMTDYYTDFTVPSIDTYVLSYTYYPNGNLKRANFDKILGGVSTPYFADSLVYDATGNHIVYFEMALDMGMGLQPFLSLSYALNGAGMIDTATVFEDQGAGLQPSGATKLFYNANGYPQKQNIYSIAGGVKSLDNTYFYNYETYTTGIKAQVATEVMSLFPNPATSSFTLQWKNYQGQYATVQLYDVAGRLLFSDAGKWTSASKNISLQGLSNGVYIANVLNADGAVIYHANVTKQ